MSKVTNATNMQKVKEEHQMRFISILFDQITTILNNGILLGDNFNGQIIECVFPVANTEVFFVHDLNRVTQYYWVLNLDAASVLYNGVSTNTVQGTYLRSSAACTATVMLI